MRLSAHHDWLPTLLAMAGDTEVKDKLLKGYKVGDMTYKVHLDGYNLVPYLTGQAEKSPRESFLYVNDDQQLTGLRYDNWKLVFMEQRAPGTLLVWSNPFTNLRVPKIFNLRTDPYERADITSNTYYDWLLDHAFLLVPAQAYVGQFLMTFKDYPQRQKAASFNMDEVFAEAEGSPGGKIERSWRGACVGSVPSFLCRMGHHHETLACEVPARFCSRSRTQPSLPTRCRPGTTPRRRRPSSPSSTR